eukprot:TRINITY_DN81028_c0_g1_i1.p1 TRINITY_DN81028_c0_g1~~TRINITY_DN81028_c0_g1_i1.p1  ORF type:complete len:197 (+),score=30.00 TRINITY_DN81028_c0_g1_i1:114-704(+)
MANELIQIHFSTLDGASFMKVVPPAMKIAELKQVLVHDCGIPADQQSLLYEDTELVEDLPEAALSKESLAVQIVRKSRFLCEKSILEWQMKNLCGESVYVSVNLGNDDWEVAPGESFCYAEEFNEGDAAEYTEPSVEFTNGKSCLAGGTFLVTAKLEKVMEVWELQPIFTDGVWHAALVKPPEQMEIEEEGEPEEV